MKIYKSFLVGMALVALVGLAGCCGGGETTVKNQTITTTLGDELKALKEAYDNGIITEKEYTESKEQLIKERSQKK